MVDICEQFCEGSKRKCIEEANMQVELKGVLSVDYKLKKQAGDEGLMHVIYYAEPDSLDAANNPKALADGNSNRAEWKTLNELKEFQESDLFDDPQLIQWAEYLENGGYVHPVGMFGPESQGGTAEGSASFTI